MNRPPEARRQRHYGSAFRIAGQTAKEARLFLKLAASATVVRGIMSASTSQTDAHGSGTAELIARYPWLPFLLPFIVYMVVGSFEPAPPITYEARPQAEGGEKTDGTAARNLTVEADNWFGLRYAHYPIVYTAKIALTIAAMVFVWPGYRQFPFRVSMLAIVVGAVGVVLWIGLCNFQLEHKLLGMVGLEGFLDLGARPAYNPLEQLAATPAWAYTFLGIRFLGLALVVPIIEEFFLRGLAMRFVISDKWWEVPFGQVTPLAVVVGTAVPMLMHPGELLAAAVWFSLVTWLMVRTRNIWDCVAAHSVTNLLLGIYVVTQKQWQLW
jgi:CAAX prenyl protease-like protein